MKFQKHIKVFTVFSFLKLKSPDIFWYQWIYPTIVFFVFITIFRFLNVDFIIFDKEAIIKDINSLMGILVGFYIAALAAVSSFTNENLDKIMKGRPLRLISVRKGNEISETLTRRRFLAIIFGYCATLAIILYIFGIFQARSVLIEPIAPWVKIIIIVVGNIIWASYTWLISSLLVVTLLGLHYLVERMHRA